MGTKVIDKTGKRIKIRKKGIERKIYFAVILHMYNNYKRKIE